MDALDRNIGFLLHDTARLLRKRFEQKARRLGMTRAQWQVLSHLKHNEGIHQGALAEILEIEPITLVRILDRLQVAGLVERRLHAGDRRVRRLHLTDAAHPILEQIREIGHETRDEAFEGVSEADRDRIVDALIKVRTNLTQRNVEGSESESSDEKTEAHYG